MLVSGTVRVSKNEKNPSLCLETGFLSHLVDCLRFHATSTQFFWFMSRFYIGQNMFLELRIQ